MSIDPSIAVVETGSGPSLLFVHGWLNDSTIWAGVTAELSSQAHCVSMDLRGHGASDAAAPGEYTRDLVLGDIGRVLDERCDGSAVIVGHSLGGYLALALAVESPERVNGLGLIAAGPGFRNPTSRDEWNQSVMATAAKQELPEGAEAISMHVDSMVLDRLGEIEAPACVVVGERDRRFLKSADVFDRHLSVRQRVIVPEAGHMVHLKQPAAVAAALSEAFLQG